MDDLPIWAKKEVSVESLAKKAKEDKKFLMDILDGTESEVTPIKYKSAKVLKLLSEEEPEILYPYWDHFVKRLSNDNTFLRSDAMMVLSNLVLVDKEKKFERIFDKCYRQLNDESMVPAANLAASSGKIALAQPNLQTKILNRLTAIDKTDHTRECKNIIKGKAIDSFGEFFDKTKPANQRKILAFVKKETKNSRNSTKKRAKRFLRKWGS